MIVVSDTSTITNLHFAKQLELLYLVYGKVVVPPAVLLELDAIEGQREEIEGLNWLTVRDPVDVGLINQLRGELDFGESQAIALAIEIDADYLIIDEQQGRSVAEGYGLRIVGLLGVLVAAKKGGYIHAVRPIVEKVRANGFRLNAKLVEEVMNELGE